MLRFYQNITQEQLAKRIGVTKSTVSAYESSVRYPSYTVLLKLASVFSVSTDFLFGKDEKHKIDISQLSEENKMMVINFVEALKAQENL